MSGRVTFYRGRSMRGTFRPAEKLFIVSISLSDAHPGDIVVFRGRDQAITVHPVSRKVADGLITRGDANASEDCVRVTAENLVGRVVCVERLGGIRTVKGGWSGLIHARMIRLRLKGQQGLWRLLARVGRGGYSWLRRNGALHHLWRPKWDQVQIETDAGRLVKYILGRRTVAIYYLDQNRFVCRKPFDLFIKPPTDSH